ncbi:efflux RND transporter permease subunit [Paludibacter sp. 221]|uniref:efflux RND transporter permease subunit n=1 Tax=Paludibacter sp. 221 TaxID=2302939 RepID=UPI0013D1F4D6|nr:efflux RND transporter permease subunit [Paludibacter sp. 221]NDV46661.1 efflux RND transporter permease subunit [Paludibacter sp. 221]
MSIYEKSVKRPIMTTLIFVAVFILGVFSVRQLPIDLFPDIEMNFLMVVTSYPGASASDIETNVTRPLENVLNTVSNLKNITSQSKENTSIISLEFEYGLDIDVITNDVRDKLEMVKSYMPDGATTPTIMKFSADMIPIMQISATAKESMPGLYKILDDNVANQLARIDGVGTVSIAGAPQREVQVYIDPNRLEAYNLTIESISQSIAVENINTPLGAIDIGSDTYSMRVNGEFTTPSELNNVVVGSYLGKNIYLSDVAVIRDSQEERAQESYTDGVQGAVIVIQKQSGSNTVEIVNKIQKALPAIQENLPSDIKLDVIIDGSDNIKNTINSLVETVLFAFLFVIIVVLFFLGRWRATVIIILTIPLSLVAAFIYLYATGSSLNIISLSALSVAIGMVVDDAIVVLENVTTHIERGSEPKSASVYATQEVAISVVASTLTLIAVFFPLTLVGGMAGVMFKELGWMVCIILFVSTTSALTFTPMLCSQMLRLDRKQSKFVKTIYGPIQRFLDGLDNWYARILNWCVRHRGATLIGALVFFILSMLPMAQIGMESMPASDSSRISITLEMPVGTRTEITKEIAKKLNDKWTEDIPELMHINYTVGQAGSDNTWASIQTNGSNIATYSIRLVDPADRNRTVFEIADIIRQELDNMPEFQKANVTTGGGMMGGEQTVDVEIYGYDFDATGAVAEELAERMREIPGYTNVVISREKYQPEYQVDFDRDKLALNGLNIATASTFLRNRINGATASLYREDGEEYKIRVVYAPEYRQSIEDIENILIYNNQGKAIRLRELGTVVERFSPPTIERKNRQRVITVQGTLSGSTLDKVVAETNRQIADMDIPSEISFDIGGSYEDMQETFGDLGALLLIIIILVFIVMAAEFESLTYPFVIMFSIPFALSGVVLLLWISGTTLSTMSLIGVIMLVGIVVKNGIVLVDYINLYRGRNIGIIKSVVDGGRSRLRPVLMTTLTTILGMLPMAIGIGEGSELWQPMGVAVIGGLTVSTVLTLVVVPVFYAIFAGNGVKRNRKKFRKLYGEKDAEAIRAYEESGMSI